MPDVGRPRGTIEVKIENGDLVIRLPLQEPRPSASGKTLVVASTGGNVRTTLLYKGKALTVGVNAYITREESTGERQ